jgi:hypothetical protein
MGLNAERWQMNERWNMNSLDRNLYSWLVIFSLCATCVFANEAPEASLDSVKSIYVMPMRERMEHFLANEIVRWGHFEVTINPRQADALLSDTTEVNIRELLANPTKVRRTSARTRGTAFLIDMKTEKVLWSAAKKPADSFLLGGDKSAMELAQEIVGQLKKDVKKPKTQPEEDSSKTKQ